VAYHCKNNINFLFFGQIYIASNFILIINFLFIKENYCERESVLYWEKENLMGALMGASGHFPLFEMKGTQISMPTVINEKKGYDMEFFPTDI
jgi:hypothetical protein